MYVCGGYNIVVYQNVISFICAIGDLRGAWNAYCKTYESKKHAVMEQKERLELGKLDLEYEFN